MLSMLASQAFNLLASPLFSFLCTTSASGLKAKTHRLLVIKNDANSSITGLSLFVNEHGSRLLTSGQIINHGHLWPV